MTNSPGPKPRQITLESAINRVLPYWGNPGSLNGDQWRYLVARQPIAVACRDTLIMNILSLKGHVTAREPEKADDYEEEIDYYEELIRGVDTDGYEEHTEAILKDALDTPFGGAAEIGRENDDPEGKVMWVKHMDAATLSPTQDPDFPVVQRVKEAPNEPPVLFPPWAVTRIKLSPRTEIARKGWGMAPPEKIYLAMELLGRGDRYYANLLLDTPAAGILDLGDIESETAESWLQSWRDLLSGPEALKIPVLYEHENPVTWIPFTKSPVEIMFDKAIQKYDSLVAAGYGITLGDIGDMSLGASSMAASIRQERKTKRTGIGYLIAKVCAYWNRVLPKHLKWEFVDLDEETMVAKGRARLANSLALANMVEKLGLQNDTAIAQLIADGMLTVPVTSLVDITMLPSANPMGQLPPGQQPQQNRETMKSKGKVPPSSGGFGATSTRSLIQLDPFIVDTIHYRRLCNLAARGLNDTVQEAEKRLTPEQFTQWAEDFAKYLADVDQPKDTDPTLRESFLGVLRAELENSDWWRATVDEGAIGMVSKVYAEALYERGDDVKIDTPSLVDSSAIAERVNEALLQALSVQAAVDVLTGAQTNAPTMQTIVNAITESICQSLVQ